MIVSLVPMNASASTNGRTAQEALTWVRSQLGKSLDYDGYPSDQPYQCVDLIKFYYAYLGCASYAVGNAYQYASNTLPSGWARYQGAQPQAGDILVYSGNTSNPYGHVAIYESDYVTYHQNFNGNQYVVKYTGKYTSCDNPYWGVIRPDFSSAAVTASWEGPTVTDITETNAKITGKVNYSSVVTTTKVGVRLYDSSNNLVASKDESVSYDNNYSFRNIWYDITSELGVTLVSGKTYKAALYAIANGKEYWSPTVSFTTAHTHSYTNKVTAATCTTKGYTTHTCACGNSYVDTYVDALGHSYKSVVTPASCTSAGYTTYTCSACQDTYKGDNVSALGHNYVNGVCTRCSATDPDYHVHNYTTVVTAPTCTAQGYTTYTCTCGDSYVGSYVDAIDHSYESVITPPTCTAQGYTTYTCSVCKISYLGNIVSALGHNYVNGACTRCSSSIATYAVTGGSITLEKTTGEIIDCDESVTAASIPAEIEGVAVTGIGARAFYQCTSLTSVTIPNSVTYIIHSAFSGCTSLTSITIPDSVTGISWGAFYRCTGLTDVYYLGSAEQWNAISIGSDNDPLTSATIHYAYHTHSYTAAVTAPTCTAKGYTTYTCTCGDSYVGSYTDALGHSYASGVCDRCGAAEPKSEDGSIIVSTAKARAGSNVTVDISLKDNPGVSAITLAIDYDTDKLELVSSEDGGLTGWFVAKKAVWTSSGADSSYNGVILSLTFKVKEGVEDGMIPVTVSYSSGDIGNNDEESLFPSVVAGGVTVFSVIPGDINGDGNVNSLDLIRLKKYIADDTTELVGSGDVNGDGNVNSLDLIRLKKYIAGSDVELF